MAIKNKYTTIESATYLSVTRQWFWRLCVKYSLLPVEQYGKMKLYALADLKRVKKLLDAK